MLGPDKEPEIKKLNFEVVILKIIGLGFNIRTFPLIDKLNAASLDSGFKYLEQIGAIQNQQLTPKGNCMANMPTEPGLSNVLIQAVQRGCLDEALRVICMMPYAGYIFNMRNKQTSDDIEKLRGLGSDLLMYNNALVQYGNV